MSTYAIAQPAAHVRAAGRRAWATVRRRASLTLICFLLLVLLPSEGYLGPARSNLVINQAIGPHGFRLAAWEVQALGGKLGDMLARPGHDLTAVQQHDLVVAYFDAIGQIGRLNRQIERIYADPSQSDPHTAAAPLQAELNELRALQQQRRSAVERILEQQTAQVLAAAGLTVGRAVWPPVRFRFSESPDYLIVSPRDRIMVQKGVFVDPQLSVAQMEQIEEQVQSRLDVSALVEGTGGFSAYPTMIIEYPDLGWTLNTIAHEWTHTYLVFYPLGWHYLDSGDTRTLNETVASIVGDEIGRQVLARFYPDKVPPADWPRPLAMRADWWERPAARAFDFAAFMRQTRLHVDKLLAAGRVAEAEAYMEAQRQIAVAHGYVLRKLNQAYFAFHGSYAVGAAATDPIGGKLRALRQRSGSLAAFVQTVARITSVAELDAALSQNRRRDNAPAIRSGALSHHLHSYPHAVAIACSRLVNTASIFDLISARLKGLVM